MLIYGSVSWAQLTKTVDISFIYGLETALPPVELTLQNGVIQKILTKEKKYTLYLTSDFSEGDVSCIYQIIKRKSYNEVYQTNYNNDIVFQLSTAIE